MHVAELWRYPVKSLRGELLDTATLSEGGVAGDRVVHVRRSSGVVTARTRHALLGLAATTSIDGQVLIDGEPWDHPLATAQIRAAAGPDVEVVSYSGQERFDVLPLTVVTDGSIEALGHDGRRLRPNIVIGGVDMLTERSWPGRALRIGDALVGVLKLRTRCIVTTIHPDTGEQDLDVLRLINRQFDSRMALDCWVVRAGTVRVGDRVELIEDCPPAPKPAGWIVGAPYVVP